MGIQDLFITPIYMVLFSFAAYFIRPYVTNKQTRKYFMPALYARFFGAIALGMIYQFYYGGGDTFNFFRQASIIYEALIRDPEVGFKILLADSGAADSETFQYTSRIYWYRSSTELIILKIIAFFSLFTFNTYSAISLFFAFFSFAGSWLMYRVFQERFPQATSLLAVAILFIPSCIFWGSGILKDTITLGALGIIIWGMNKLIYKRRLNLVAVGLIMFSAWLISAIKIYILICAIPALIIWWYFENVKALKNPILKLLFVPILLVSFLGGGYFLLTSVAGTSEAYSLDTIAERAYITSYDIRFYSGKNAGSGYDLGAQDGSFSSLIKLLPAAINVSLFRPYLWEVRNPLMVLSALEAILFLVLTIRFLLKLKTKSVRSVLKSPILRMCMVFSLAFAFAVGVSTYNFGSLSRYKIPLLPFYGAFLAITLSASTSRTPRRSL